MKKRMKLFFVLLIGLLPIFLLGCSTEPTPQLPVNTGGKPSFVGIVKEVADDYIEVQVTQSEHVAVGNLFQVNRTIQGQSDTGTYQAGDQVRVIFDGKVAASYPGKILTVYSITVLLPA